MDICTGTIKMTSTYYTTESNLRFCDWCLHNGCANCNSVSIELDTYGCCCCVNEHPKLERCFCLDHSKKPIFSVYRGVCSVCKVQTSHEKQTVCDQCSATLKICLICGLKGAKPYNEYQNKVITEILL